MRKTNKKIILWLSIPILLLCIYGVYIYSLKQKIEEKINKFAQQDIPTTLQQLDSSYKIPTNNSADIYVKAFAEYIELPVEQNDTFPVLGFTDLPPYHENLPEQMKNDIDTYIKKNAKLLTLLEKASKIEECRYPIDLKQGYETLLPHLSDVRNSIKVLQLKARLESENNNSNESIKALFCSLKLTNSLKKEPLLISQLVRIACFSTNMQICEQIINQNQLTKDQLSTLATYIHDQENLKAIELSMNGEIACGIDFFQNFDLEKLKSVGCIATTSLYQINGGLERDFLNFLNTTEQFLNAIKMKPNECLKSLHALENEITSSSYILSRMLLPAYISTIQKHYNNIEEIRVTLTAIAVEQYKMENAKLPDSLEQLIPTYLKEIPNPRNQQPVLYKKTDNGYLVYSFGENDQDDNAVSKNDANNSNNWDVVFKVNK